MTVVVCRVSTSVSEVEDFAFLPTRTASTSPKEGVVKSDGHGRSSGCLHIGCDHR